MVHRDGHRGCVSLQSVTGVAHLQRPLDRDQVDRRRRLAAVITDPHHGGDRLMSRCEVVLMTVGTGHHRWHDGITPRWGSAPYPMGIEPCSWCEGTPRVMGIDLVRDAIAPPSRQGTAHIMVGNGPHANKFDPHRDHPSWPPSRTSLVRARGWGTPPRGKRAEYLRSCVAIPVGSTRQANPMNPGASRWHRGSPAARRRKGRCGGRRGSRAASHPGWH